MNKQESGRLGGKTTATRHGSMHMEAIGRAGFWATVERYFGGDAWAYMAALRARQQPTSYSPSLGCQVLKAS